MMRPLLYILLVGFVISCGKTTDQTPSPIVEKENASPQKPLEIFKDQEECSSAEVPDESIIHLFLFENTSASFSPKIFPWQTLKKKQVISKILYHGKYENIVDGDLVLKIEEEQPKSLILCPSITTPKPSSIESAALNTSYFILKTHHFFHKNTKIDLPPVSLHLLPEIIQKLSRNSTSKTYLTDNAFYRESTSRITFLPHSQESKNSGFFMNMWEIPFIPSHEYAHHIFKTIFSNHQFSESVLSFNCFNHSSSETFKFNQTREEIKVSHFLNALNEGFADLIAFYSLSEDEKRLEGVPCIEVTRDVASPFFKDGTAKVISQEVLNTFFHSKKSIKFNSCERTNFQSIHTFGAILAHNVDKFLSSYTTSNEKKLRILVTWLSLIRHYHKENEKLAPKRYFDTIFALFLRLTTTHFDKNFDQNTCNEIERIYPRFHQHFRECSSF